MPSGLKGAARLISGLTKPRKTILGSDFAEEIVEAGSDVRSFKPGDRVFGIDGADPGSYAEFRVIAAKGALTHLPDKTKAVVEKIRELMEQGAITPVIDRTWSLEQMAEAHTYAESGKKKGALVINLLNGE